MHLGVLLYPPILREYRIKLPVVSRNHCQITLSFTAIFRNSELNKAATRLEKRIFRRICIHEL